MREWERLIISRDLPGNRINAKAWLGNMCRNLSQGPERISIEAAYLQKGAFIKLKIVMVNSGLVHRL